jgi:hypothetical protein
MEKISGLYQLNYPIAFPDNYISIKLNYTVSDSKFVGNTRKFIIGNEINATYGYIQFATSVMFEPDFSYDNDWGAQHCFIDFGEAEQAIEGEEA